MADLAAMVAAGDPRVAAGASGAQIVIASKNKGTSIALMWGTGMSSEAHIAAQ